jgi:hypothetical protein
MVQLTYPQPSVKGIARTLPRRVSRILQVFDIDKSRPNKHHRLKKQYANIPLGIILRNTSQKFLQIQHWHKTMHPLNIRP